MISLVLIIAAFLSGKTYGRKDSRESSNSPSGTVESFISNAPLTAPQFGGKIFVAYKTLGEIPEGNGKILYAWAYIQEYYVEDGTLRTGSGASIPLAIHTKPVGEFFLPTSYETPRDGSLFAADVAKLFPKNIQDLISGKNTAQRNAEIKKLENQTLANAKAYFKL